jgi:hypothetical protein
MPKIKVGGADHVIKKKKRARSLLIMLLALKLESTIRSTSPKKLGLRQSRKA